MKQEYSFIEIIKNVVADETVGKVLVIPARTPPHKICDDLACDADRLEMCKIAVAGIEKVFSFNPLSKLLIRHTANLVVKPVIDEADFL